MGREAALIWKRAHQRNLPILDLLLQEYQCLHLWRVQNFFLHQLPLVVNFLYRREMNSKQNKKVHTGTLNKTHQQLLPVSCPFPRREDELPYRRHHWQSACFFVLSPAPDHLPLGWNLDLSSSQNPHGILSGNVLHNIFNYRTKSLECTDKYM